MVRISRNCDNGKRTLVVVGHDVQQDIKYLKTAGLPLDKYTDIFVDSKDLHQIWKVVDSGRSLENVLFDLGLIYQHLHNAGNDAVFTLRAVLGCAIQCNMQAAKQLMEEDKKLQAIKDSAPLEDVAHPVPDDGWGNLPKTTGQGYQVSYLRRC